MSTPPLTLDPGPRDSLRVCDLSITIDVARAAPVHAVRHASLDLRPGEVHGIIGGSGSGKTTLGQALLGLVAPTAQVQGHIVIDGAELTPGERGFNLIRGRRMGLVPQSPAGSFTPVRRLGAQLAEVIRALGGVRSPAELLSLVSLDAHVADLFPHQLSGGMAQRAAVAFALAGAPSFIVADEPTSALDPDLTVDLLLMFRQLADDGMGVVIISHDIADLIEVGVCDEVSVMRHGRIVESGPADLVFGDPQTAFTRALLAALPTGGMCLTSGFERG